MADVNQREQLYEALPSDEFADMIVHGYNPDRDFMFLQHPDDNADKVTVYLKDFSWILLDIIQLQKIIELCAIYLCVC